jgi:hypothetical protein
VPCSDLAHVLLPPLVLHSSLWPWRQNGSSGMWTG